jgi:hypothetical protein
MNLIADAGESCSQARPRRRGAKMPELLSKADRVSLEKWTRLHDEADKHYKAATTDVERDKWYERRAHAATVIDGISARVHRRQNVVTRSKPKKKVKKAKDVDPEPDHLLTCDRPYYKHNETYTTCDPKCPNLAWFDRQPVVPTEIDPSVTKVARRTPEQIAEQRAADAAKELADRIRLSELNTLQSRLNEQQVRRDATIADIADDAGYDTM